MLQTDESRMTKVKCNPMLLRFDEHKGYLRDDGNARSLYHYLVAKKHCRSHMEQYWALKCGCHITNFEWQSIWLLTKFLEEKKLAIFRYKMLHNILPCRFLLHRWRLADSPLCNICNVQEDYEHMFIKCRKIQDSWKTLCDCFERLGISNIRPCLKLLVMGYKIIQTDYIELNEVIFLFGIFKSYCLSDGWKSQINVTNIVKREIQGRNLYYKKRKLCILNKVCQTLNG